MVERERQHSFSRFLDKAEKNKLFVRFVFSPDYARVEEFAVVYLAEIEGEIREVLRYDCSKRETVHVHNFSYKKQEKKFVDKEKSFDTMEEFMEEIEKNWRLYRLKFREKQQFI